VLSININNNVINLSVTFTATFWRLSLQQTWTVCHTLSTSAAATVGQSSCVRVCAITDDYDKGDVS